MSTTIEPFRVTDSITAQRILGGLQVNLESPVLLDGDSEYGTMKVTFTRDGMTVVVQKCDPKGEYACGMTTTYQELVNMTE